MSNYIIIDSELNDFLAKYAKSMGLEDEDVEFFYKRPVRFLGAHAEGSSLMLWGEDV